MAQIELTQTHLLVNLSKSEQIWAMHRDLSIPVALIKGAEVAHKEVWQTLVITLAKAPNQRYKRLIIAIDTDEKAQKLAAAIQKAISAR